MDRAPLDIRRSRLAVDGVPEDVEHSRESSLADRRLQRPASVFHRDATDETLGGGQRDSTHAMRVELSQHLDSNFPVLRVQQRIDGRQMCIEPNIYDTAAHRDHRAEVRRTGSLLHDCLTLFLPAGLTWRRTPMPDHQGLHRTASADLEARDCRTGRSGRPRDNWRHASRNASRTAVPM